MGQTKTAEQIENMAEILRDFDVVAIQEIVAGYGGSQAVAKLADELNRKGTKWSYAISDPTQSSPYSSERYAFLWKPSKVNLSKRPWLDQNYAKEIEREPFMIKFSYQNTSFVLINFHAIPKTKQPEREIKYFKYFPNIYKNERLIFLGDYNVTEKNTVFNPLKKMQYLPALKNQKTTLRTKCLSDGCLASAYDNIFYNKNEFEKYSSGVIHFYEGFDSLKEARKLSDHVPIYISLKSK
jgi:endonuclease/exonuclease/phosphatase family metal-dependent hydrolase